MREYSEVGIEPEIKNFLNYSMVFIVAAGSFAFHTVYPGVSLLGMWLMFGVCAAVGWLAGRILSHRIDGDGNLALACACACALVVAWLIPPAGAFLSAMVSELAEISRRRRYLYLCLSLLCGIATVANAGWAIAIHASNPAG